MQNSVEDSENSACCHTFRVQQETGIARLRPVLAVGTIFPAIALSSVCASLMSIVIFDHCVLLLLKLSSFVVSIKLRSRDLVAFCR